MTPTMDQKIIKKLNILILIGVIILVSTWITFFWTTKDTTELINSSTAKITTTQTETLSEIFGITAQLTDIRAVLKMCEKFPPPDPERLKRIDAEIRGNYNNFPNQEEMIEQLESYD